MIIFLALWPNTKLCSFSTLVTIISYSKLKEHLREIIVCHSFTKLVKKILNTVFNLEGFLAPFTLNNDFVSQKYCL